jgi:uncharacterized integral membrane protein
VQAEVWLSGLNSRDAPMSTERLRQAVAGSAGSAGRCCCRCCRRGCACSCSCSSRTTRGSGSQQRLSSLAVARALVLTLLLAFIVMNWQQAASELRQVQAEAPIFGSTLTGSRRAGAVAALRAGHPGAAGRLAAARTGRRIGGLLR